MTPDTVVFTLAFSTYFGVERAFYQLAHNLVLSMPGLGFLRKFGTVAASPANARKALDAEAALLVYPGGDYEVHRPSWQRNRVDFGGRKGFIRLAIEQDMPIVPVVSIGGQETALFLTRGERLARLLMLDKLFRLKVLPISLSLPWISTSGDMMGHIPLPAKITIETLPPINVREEFGPEPDPSEVYDHLTRIMQDTLDALATERRLPVLGMRVTASTHLPAPIDLVWSIVSDPERMLDFMSGLTRWEIAGEHPTGVGARYRMLFRVGSAEVGGLVELVEWSPPCEMAWTSVTGIDQRGRWRLRRATGGRTRVELRLAYGVAGSGLFGWVAERIAAPVVRGHVRRSLEQLRRIVEHEQRRRGPAPAVRPRPSARRPAAA